MRAVVYDTFGGPLEVREVPDPEPPAHGAVIRVEATGLCRSDWHGWMGHDPDIASFPHVPGHELAGVVESVGPAVTRWRGGERVTVPFVCACGSCEQCARGDHQICDRQRQPGFTHWGSFAELVAVDWADVNLVALPEGVDAVEAASLGCRFATAYRALLQVGRLRAGEWVAVHGCGGVGLSATMIAAAAGAGVVAVDPDPAALELAARAGAAATVRVAAGEPAAAHVVALTGGGAHLGVDAAGSPAALRASIESLRKRGRHVQIGLLPDPPAVPMHLVVARELEVLGAHGMAAHAYPELMAQVASQRLRPGSLVARTIPLEEAPAALAGMGAAGAAGITVVRP